MNPSVCQCAYRTIYLRSTRLTQLSSSLALALALFAYLAAAAEGGGRGGGGSPACYNPYTAFLDLLAAAGVSPGKEVLAILTGNAVFASRLIAVGTTEHAIQLYNDAARVPRAEAREFLKEKWNVVISSVMPESSETSTLMFAFDTSGGSYKPAVLKVIGNPGSRAHAESECALFTSLRSIGIPESVYLVPVRRVDLHEGGEGGDSSRPSSGILMPFYPATLQRLPAPVLPEFACLVLERMAATLRFIHANGWMHGDVKPSNIFLDAEGVVWLGDYGSSTKLSEIAAYSRGTPAFQCADISPTAQPLAFDLAGLLVALLVKLDLLDLRKAPYWGWSAGAIAGAVAKLDAMAVDPATTALAAAMKALWADIRAPS